jgi:hypothetical protein
MGTEEVARASTARAWKGDCTREARRQRRGPWLNEASGLDLKRSPGLSACQLHLLFARLRFEEGVGARNPRSRAAAHSSGLLQSDGVRRPPWARKVLPLPERTDVMRYNELRQRRAGTMLAKHDAASRASAARRS